MANLGRVTKGDQHIFINNVEIPGVQSVRASYSTSATDLKYIGLSKSEYAPRGPQVGQVSFSTLLISDDWLIPLTGNTGVNGFVVKNKGTPTQNFSFSSGYLTSYNFRAAIGEIPQVNGSFSVVGNIGRLSNAQADVAAYFSQLNTLNPTGLLRLTGPGSIQITVDSDFTTNRVQACDLTIDVPRNPFYQLGATSPYAVEINYPLRVEINFTLDVNDYTNYKMRDYPTAPRNKNITISVNDYTSNQPITTFAFSGMLLTKEEYGVSVNGNATTTVTYQTTRTR